MINEEYYQRNKEPIVEALINNSKELVYEYKYKDWLDFIKRTKDDIQTLKIISMAVKMCYLEKNNSLTEEEAKQFKELAPIEKQNFQVIINSYFDEDIAYSTLEKLERLGKNTHKKTSI